MFFKQLRKCGIKEKLQLLTRTVLSLVLFKMSRWPFQQTVAESLDALQCKMISYMRKCPRFVSESIEQYCNRRSREARGVAARCGYWSKIWAKRVTLWPASATRAATDEQSRAAGIPDRRQSGSGVQCMCM